MAFTEDQLQRYSRHILLPEVGGKGQKKIAAARVFLIGAGGLGSPSALYLAAAGVGTLGIIDSDVVDLSNLQRQVLHSAKTLHRPKVESAQETLSKYEPGRQDRPLRREDLVRKHSRSYQGLRHRSRRLG
ncbi:MAG: ThiF family adenylyltransferase [Candidatus Manganitrophus sp.]|nr:ThiF family adenylyltransferase [Candidatus Manganitrophus sp.]